MTMNLRRATVRYGIQLSHCPVRQWFTVGLIMNERFSVGCEHRLNYLFKLSYLFSNHSLISDITTTREPEATTFFGFKS